MCNLSQGILAEGEERGKAIGEAGIITAMFKNGMTIEEIARSAGKSIAYVESIVIQNDTGSE